MNEQLFKPAGLFAMIVKYKSDQDSRESANSLFARFGVSGAKVDFSTNEAIAKYDRTLSGESTGSGSRSMSDRMKGMRLASGQTQGAVRLPECKSIHHRSQLRGEADLFQPVLSSSLMSMLPLRRRVLRRSKTRQETRRSSWQATWTAKRS